MYKNLGNTIENSAWKWQIFHSGFIVFHWKPRVVMMPILLSILVPLIANKIYGATNDAEAGTLTTLDIQYRWLSATLQHC